MYPFVVLTAAVKLYYKIFGWNCHDSNSRVKPKSFHWKQKLFAI